jgi:galactitol-specific phosphotransferase system IIB component
MRIIFGNGPPELCPQITPIAQIKKHCAAHSPTANGKQADLMIVKGNPATNIADIEKVEIVFKDGIGYDSEKLIQSVQGLVGIR